MTTIRDKVTYGFLAVIIAAGMFLGVNSSIEAQTDVFKVQVSTSRALACTLSLGQTEPDGGRNPEAVAQCWTQEGLRAPRIP